MTRVNALDVYRDGKLVAAVKRSRGGLQTTYASLAAPMLSVALPPRSRAYGEARSRPFLHGLLPEGETRRVIAYDLAVGSDGGDDLDLLGMIGRDCAGALSLVPAGEPAAAATGGYEPLSDAEIGRRLRALADHPLGVDHRVRLSLGGVQPKLLLAHKPGEGWLLPVGGAPSTHILKPAPRRLPGVVANELFCQTAADRAGLQAARTDRAVFDGVEALVSTRYDRTIDAASTIARLHQEDGCQALSIHTVPLERKYQSRPDGLPSFRALAAVLDRWAEVDARHELLGVVAATAAFGNADMHGKNVSFLHRGPGVELAPIYDMVSTTGLGDGSIATELGMHIGAATDIDDVRFGDLVDEATEWGIRPGRARDVIADTLARLADAIATTAAELADTPESLINHLAGRAHALLDQAVARE